MDLEYSRDQDELRGAIREYLVKRYSTKLIRDLQREDNDGCPRHLWQELADQGWLGMAFPEEYNGGGASLFDLGIFYEESGRVLLPTAYYSTIHAGLLIEELGSQAQRSHLLREITTGALIGTVAFAEPGVFHDDRLLTTTARHDRGWALNGRKVFTANAEVADLMIVIARVESGQLTGFLVPRTAPGVTVVAQSTIGKDKQCRVDLNDVRLDGDALLGELTDIQAGLAGVTEAVTALQIMEMVGGARRVLEMTVDYVKERRQFDRPIGSFQAVQHHVANMAIALHGARLTALQAMWLISEGLPAARELAIAKSAASEAYPAITRMAHQLHGGLGIVLEHDLHLWSQRALSTALGFGSSDHHLDRLADQLAQSEAPEAVRARSTHFRCHPRRGSIRTRHGDDRR